MRGKQLWGALLATWTVLIPGLAFGQSGGLPFGQSGEDYAPPDTVFPLPLSSTRPEAGGLFVSAGFMFQRQTNPIKDQAVAVRGFVTTTDDVLDEVNSLGTFIGSGQQALNVQQVSGPNSYQPGFKIEMGWKFGDGSAISFAFNRLTEAKYSAAATLFPMNFQLGDRFAESFLTAFVFNFPNDYNGPTGDVLSNVRVIPTFTITTTVITPATESVAASVVTLPPQTGQLVPINSQTTDSAGNLIIVTSVQDPIPASTLAANNGAAGIWNAATVMEISFVQRFTDYYINYRVPVLDTECYRMNGLMGPRATWIWERFKWRTVNQDLEGQAGPQDTAIYSNVVSNYMYGFFCGTEHEWYWGHGFAGMLDMRATGYVDIVKERAKYELGAKYAGPAHKRARRDYTFVPEVEAALSLMWYPIEGVQVKAGYNVMAFFNTLSSPRPISFNYSGLDPAYESTFRIFDGFQAAIALSF